MASVITNGTFMASRWEESQHQGWGQGAEGSRVTLTQQVQLRQRTWCVRGIALGLRLAHNKLPR